VAARLADLKAAGVESVVYDGDDPALPGRAYGSRRSRPWRRRRRTSSWRRNAGFGGSRIAAPQASLMAVVGRGIMERKTEWILILIGILMGLSLILMQVKSPCS